MRNTKKRERLARTCLDVMVIGVGGLRLGRKALRFEARRKIFMLDAGRFGVTSLYVVPFLFYCVNLS